MRKTLLVPMAATMLATGCVPDLGLGDWSGFGGIGPCCAPGIMTMPSTSDLLRGDTIQLSTLFFPTGPDSAIWSVADSSFRVLRFSGARDTMVARAAARGSALVMVSRGGVSASLVLFAHDSSDVSSVRVHFPPQGFVLRQNIPELATGANLLVGSRTLWTHAPIWSSGDTTKAVIVMKPATSFEPKPRAVIVPRGAGQLFIFASWGTLRDSVSLTISP